MDKNNLYSETSSAAAWAAAAAAALAAASFFFWAGVLTYLTLNQCFIIETIFKVLTFFHLCALLAVVLGAAGGELGLGVGAVLDQAAPWRGLKIHNWATVGDLLGQAT